MNRLGLLTETRNDAHDFTGVVHLIAAVLVADAHRMPAADQFRRDLAVSFHNRSVTTGEQHELRMRAEQKFALLR